jgi:hypothetical protein
MQREILAALAVVEPCGFWRHERPVCTPKMLQLAMAQRRGAWCTTECRTPLPPELWQIQRLRGPHQPHSTLSRPWRVAFSRALRGLVERGLVVAADHDGVALPYTPKLHIQYLQLDPARWPENPTFAAALALFRRPDAHAVSVDLEDGPQDQHLNTAGH